MDQEFAALKRLGEYVTRRRREGLDLTVHEAAVQAPMSPTAWTNVEQGRSVSKATRAGVERVLGWEPGSLRAILLGGEPTLISQQPAVTESTARQQLRKMIEMAEQLPDGTPGRDEILELRKYLEPPTEDALQDERGLNRQSKTG